MNTYYLRTRQNEIVIDSDDTNKGFGPLDRESLEEVIDALISGREHTIKKLRKEEREEKKDIEYLRGIEKEGIIRLNIKRINKEDEGFDRPKPKSTKLRAKDSTTQPFN